MAVLIAGGAGYIGSTVASACLDADVTPVILDSLVTGCREFTDGRIFYEGDTSDVAVVDRVFSDARTPPRWRTARRWSWCRSPWPAHQEGAAFPVTGVNYPTRVGTGIRDYVHVRDLAAAHVAAIEKGEPCSRAVWMLRAVRAVGWETVRQCMVMVIVVECRERWQVLLYRADPTGFREGVRGHERTEPPGGL
ncbi:NAD-dependent epimerase/dehydratase family protein [Streptomyces buecherae]|uniref:NAD-dependent epimerase/dehydratase family protein n=1 Tax=Streptomyces buecherae TaxID=2763006 RepID=UPI0027DF7412|nr:NAD-dependent epimerase/dehydratase family protein [Streptomyces buecherae]